ncbi:ABC transporter permease [Lutispora thermophila]|uniref:Oligopeptide transport system permease protein n=1 Tax=Lutispora thermophila DSM 19022 TaxID=1122184 RepID=A0A1M6B686_9FIRM|nr:ABC transporter permease [Lutispora thermophila]SHI43993.1 oligopeptide transport system permease protein [Lutispora thermophila DSM 19022]
METISKEKFRRIQIDYKESEKIARPQIGYWQDVWRRLKSNKVAILSLIILVIIVFMTIIGPYLSGYDFKEIDSAKINQRPSKENWFGTDELGRDIFARVWKAGRVSMVIGITGALISAVVGTMYGGFSAYFGGRVDTIMMRIVEILISVPYLLVVILISIITDSRSLGTMMISLTLTGWCGTARMVRGQMLQLKSQEYILAAEALGVKPLKIIMKHLIPNVLNVLIVSISFDIPGYIFSETFLSYIGLGIQPPNTSWGALASAAQRNFIFYPYQLFFPALMIALTMLTFTLLGDGLRDALDPRLRE